MESTEEECRSRAHKESVAKIVEEVATAEAVICRDRAVDGQEVAMPRAGGDMQRKPVAGSWICMQRKFRFGGGSGALQRSCSSQWAEEESEEELPSVPEFPRLGQGEGCEEDDEQTQQEGGCGSEHEEQIQWEAALEQREKGGHGVHDVHGHDEHGMHSMSDARSEGFGDTPSFWAQPQRETDLEREKKGEHCAHDVHEHDDHGMHGMSEVRSEGIGDTPRFWAPEEETDEELPSISEFPKPDQEEGCAEERKSIAESGFWMQRNLQCREQKRTGSVRALDAEEANCRDRASVSEEVAMPRAEEDLQRRSVAKSGPRVQRKRGVGGGGKDIQRPCSSRWADEESGEDLPSIPEFPKVEQGEESRTSEEEQTQEEG